jgi:anti-anti-sigma factor
VVDLSRDYFLDSSGVSVLVRARAVLARDDRELAVVCPRGPVRRIFEVAGIADLLALYDSREDAAGALRPAG